MATKLNFGSVTTSDTLAIEFAGLATLEQQVSYVVSLLLSKQIAYNVANPTDLKNVVAISPAYANSQVTLQAVLPLQSDAVLDKLYSEVTVAIPS